MAKALILPGRYGSILSRLESVTVSGADSSFPASNLYDGRPERVWREASKGWTNQSISWTNQILLNGRFEGGFASGVPNNWTHNGTGSSADETSVTSEGSHAVRLNTTGSAITQRVIMRAGEPLQITGDMRSLAGSGDTATVRIQSERNGYSLNSSGVWGISRVTLFSETATSYQAKSLLFNAQTADTIGGPWDIVQVTLAAAVDGAYFDNWWIRSGIDLWTFHGHNFGSNLADEAGSALTWVELKSGNVSPTTSRQVILRDAITSPAFYGRLSSILYDKFWTIQLQTGGDSAGLEYSQLSPVEVGELGVGAAIELIQNPSHGVQLIEDWPQERQEVDGIPVQTFNLSRHPRRRVVLPFNTTTPTYEQVRDFIYRITRGGQDPIVIVPDDGRPEVVFGHVSRGFEPSDLTFDRWGYDIEIEEAPFAVPLS